MAKVDLATPFDGMSGKLSSREHIFINSVLQNKNRTKRVIQSLAR